MQGGDRSGLVEPHPLGGLERSAGVRHAGGRPEREADLFALGLDAGEGGCQAAVGADRRPGGGDLGVELERQVHHGDAALLEQPGTVLADVAPRAEVVAPAGGLHAPDRTPVLPRYGRPRAPRHLERQLAQGPPARVEEWLADVAPDVVCLQETKLADGAFPSLAFQSLGYESVHHGEGRWNGVAILSRVGLEDPLFGFGPGDDDPEARLVWATCGGIRIASAYVPNGRSLDHDHYQYKLAGGWPSCASTWPTTRTPPRRWWWRATTTSPPPTTTSTTRPSSSTAPIRVRPSAPRWPSSRRGAWSTRSGSCSPSRAVQLVGLPGRETSTITAGCASTCCSATEVRSPQRAAFATIDRNARKGEKPSDHAPVIIDLAD